MTEHLCVIVPRVTNMYRKRPYFMARTYAPSKVSEVVALWKADLAKVNKKAAEALADPSEYTNLFPDFDEALRAEQMVRSKAASRRRPAASFPDFESMVVPNLIEELKLLSTGGNGAGVDGDVDVEEEEVGGGEDKDFAEADKELDLEPEPEVDPEAEEEAEEEPSAEKELSEPAAAGGDEDDDWGLEEEDK
mmetsp:Transcript_23783/g.58315  ORF Transcript_23783/g.58315 Transcript_23783/m.58315 type:complete len:192 (-) Transcript_23783:222-797(-)